jgi:secreted trypsin-like serine protease
MYDEITERTFCTFTSVGQGSCFGDAGGVLVNIQNSEAMGIAAFGSVGSRCAIMPDCYTKLSFFIDWIQVTTSLN